MTEKPPINEDDLSTSDVIMRHGSYEQPSISSRPVYEQYKLFMTNPNLFPLSKKGEDEVRQTISKLPGKEKIDLIVTSPFLRASQSAHVAQEELMQGNNPKDVPIIVSKLLEEVKIPPDIISEEEFNSALISGGLEHVTKIIFERWAASGEGERPDEVEKRVKTFLKFVRRLHKWAGDKKLLIVSHGSFSRAIKRVVEGVSITAPRKEGETLKTAEKMTLLRNKEKEQPNIGGLQEGEFSVISGEELLKEK